MYYVYILTNKTHSVLYTGVTSDLKKRIYQHKNHLIEGFTSRYNVNLLVYFDSTSDVNEAIAYEKKIKGWLRSKKEILINSINPQWKDLSEGWYE